MKVDRPRDTANAQATRHRWFRRLAYSAGGLAISCALVAAFAWWYAGQLLLPANQPIALPTTQLPIEAATFPSDSGTNVATWYVPTENATRTVILVHGIRSSRLEMLGRAEMFHRRGLAVLMIDLQAHGESPGDAMTLGYLERHDVSAAVAFARSKNPVHRIIVVGRSLGGAAALLGSPLGIDALVVESVYSTVEQAIENRLTMRLGPVGKLATPLFAWQSQARLGISTEELRPIDRIASVGCPVLVVGGELDEHTTAEETERLFAAASEPKQLLIFEGAGHTNYHRFDGVGYEHTVMEFIDRYVP